MYPIREYEKKLASFRRLMLRHRSLSGVRLEEGKWSLAEMLAHLMDSAANNHQRFVRLQLERELDFPGYDAEGWVRVTKPNDYGYLPLVRLWEGYNRFILHLIAQVDEGCLGYLWKTPEGELTLDFLIRDYWRHMDWHRELFERRVAEIKAARRAQGRRHKPHEPPRP